MTERTFVVGDFVYLKLVPYQFQSLASHTSHKLHPIYYGPYEVLEKIGPMAYKLKLHVGPKSIQCSMSVHRRSTGSIGAIYYTTARLS